MKYYIGITIGPIFDTIVDAVTPAQMWFSSTLFSDITRRLCKSIKNQIGNADIYSPYYDENDEDGLKDGVGKYHDRIIFAVITENIDEISKKLNSIIESVKAETIDQFAKGIKTHEGKAFLKEYLMIEYVILEEDDLAGENCILKISPYLDELELMRTFATNDSYNPIKETFTGKENGKNYYVKESKLFNVLSEDAKQSIENSKKDIKSIEDISGHTVNKEKKDSFKYTNYYAIVAADGDKMGAFLSTIGNDTGMITTFSECCLEYDKVAAKLVTDFTGMPIYAGGDDLLFIAPVVNKNENKNETIFGLCKEISKKFTEIVRKKITDIEIPTISFGISIQYYKFPLYEAMNRARNLLGKAKNVPEGESKNRIALTLEKHSGQSVDIIVGNEFIPDLEEYFTNSLKDTTEEALHSIYSKLLLFKPLVVEIDKRMEKNGYIISKDNYPWDNLFDNDEQKKYKNYLQSIQELYYEKILKNNVRIYSDDKDKNYTQALLSILKFMRFLTERGKDNECCSI